MELRANQCLVGEDTSSLEIHDRLEDHPEALVAKGFLEHARRRHNGVCRFHAAILPSGLRPANSRRWLEPGGWEIENASISQRALNCQNSVMLPSSRLPVLV